MKFLRRFKIKGEKKLFLVFGIINFFITNIILQISLLLISTFQATLLSQIVNLLIGYFLYGKKVFKFKKLSNIVFKKYFLLAIVLWIFNFALIQSFFFIGLNKNLTAFLIIPLLVLISYLSQKYFVFR